MHHVCRPPGSQCYQDALLSSCCAENVRLMCYQCLDCRVVNKIISFLFRNAERDFKQPASLSVLIKKNHMTQHET